jgi:hypothetical protein
MPVNEQDQQVDTTETVPLSPEWGGVPVHGGDNADATGGPPTEAEPIELEADEDAAPVAEADDTAPDAESDEDAAPVAEADDAAPPAESGEDGEPEAEAVEAPVGADA